MNKISDSSRSLGQSKSKKEESQSRSINLEQIDNMNNTGISNIDYFSLKYQPFKKHAFSNTSHKTTEIGELKHVDLGNYDRSTFSSVIAYLEELSLAFTEYNLAITKNLKFIATKLADLEADSRADLSKFTKDIGNTFLNSYEYYSKMMNNQRIENMRLQSEVNILISEKNTLRNQVKNLTYSCEKMEKYLGVTQLSND